ncbi:MAG: hypothetical protein OES21_01640, partial [Myxococcales bacterium]|nr:hypothetical protein [Myxococcales bacterium]
RWSVVAQALTGEFSPYECNSETRIGGIYAGEYDEGYFLPHIQLPQELAAYTGSQGGNGVLDIYLERIKFGLMTFDSIGTLSDRPRSSRRSTSRLPLSRQSRSAPRACTRMGTTLPTRSRAPAAWSTCSTTGHAPSSRPKAAW